MPESFSPSPYSSDQTRLRRLHSYLLGDCGSDNAAGRGSDSKDDAVASIAGFLIRESIRDGLLTAMLIRWETKHLLAPCQVEEQSAQLNCRLQSDIPPVRFLSHGCTFAQLGSSIRMGQYRSFPPHLFSSHLTSPLQQQQHARSLPRPHPRRTSDLASRRGTNLCGQGPKEMSYSGRQMERCKGRRTAVRWRQGPALARQPWQHESSPRQEQLLP